MLYAGFFYRTCIGFIWGCYRVEGFIVVLFPPDFVDAFRHQLSICRMLACNHALLSFCTKKVLKHIETWGVSEKRGPLIWTPK